ncbi:aldehyde dehydrogenase family protein, partial [Actinoplanes sp. NPDC048791]|uniref:aldehyde dehydrogenase family protein n=1 Tax=Actinoplanes sp. NPDC048791 TaxID=3154623 RepID=UPI0033DD040E
MHDVGQLIGGTWTPGSGSRRLTVLNPTDGTPVTSVAVASEADVAAAVKAARDAAPLWGRT